MSMPVIGMSVLIVDDDPLTREFAQSILEQSGYSVRVASDGEAAIAALDEQHADIVLLDILMPRKDGLETLLELKRRSPDIAVIATSASVVQMRNDYLAIAEQFGADAILRKPFTPQTLSAAVAQCGHRDSADSAPRRA